MPKFTTVSQVTELPAFKRCLKITCHWANGWPSQPNPGCLDKLRLAMSHLDIRYARIPIDITRGESRTTHFLRINPNGKVPATQPPEGHFILESNPASWYHAIKDWFKRIEQTENYISITE